jgi:hypothetical protein
LIGTTVFDSLPGVAPNEKTGSARTAAEPTSINASIAAKHRAKGAVTISFTRAPVAVAATRTNHTATSSIVKQT